MAEAKVDPVLRILYERAFRGRKRVFRGANLYLGGSCVPNYADPGSVRRYVQQEAWLHLPQDLRRAALDKYGVRFLDIQGGRLYNVLSHREYYNNCYVWLDKEDNIDLATTVIDVVSIKLLDRTPE